MASSSSVPETNMQEAVPTTQEARAYEIRGRTMSLEECELNVQTENPVDFNSLSHHRCELRSYYEAQGLMDYFNMLNDPTYKNLIRHFWVRAQVYDRKAAQQKMYEKVLIDPTLKVRKTTGGGGGLNCVLRNFSSFRSEELFSGSKSEIVQSLSEFRVLVQRIISKRTEKERT